MNTSLRCAVVLLVASGLALVPAEAQFGQNKIAYDRFDWKTYSSPHFDVYYYGTEAELLQDVVSYAESAYLKISKDLDHELKVRIPLVIYKTHAEFEQTNITMEDLPEAVGAFAEPMQNRMVVPIDEPPDRLYAVIAHELTHIFQYSIFFEGYLGRALRSNPPAWIMEGMASYLGQDEDNFDRMVIRDAVVNNILPPVQDLVYPSFLAYRYGHAVFDFIEKEFGKEGLRSFIYEYRKVLLTNNLEKAVKEAFGCDMPEFNRRFNRYLRKKYFPVLLDKKAPEDYGKEIGLKKEGVFTFSPTLSPSGELVSALATPKMDLDLIVLSAEDGSLIRNLTKGWTNRYQYLVAEAFSGRRDLSWSPASDQIAVFARKENARPLLLFDGLTGRLTRMIRLPGIAQCKSPVFSPDGKRVAFEGNKDGVVDLFEMDIATGSIRNLTQDEFFDANPWYAADGKTLVYNRRIGSYWKVFSVDLEDPSRKTQLTFGPSSDLQPAYSRDGKTLFYSSDRGPGGIFNIYALDLSSGEIRQYTDVVGGCFSPVEMAERNGEPYLVFTAFFEGTFRLFRMPLKQPEARLAPAAAGEAAPEIHPFEPPLALTLDAGKIGPYRHHWEVEAPYISVGVADNGTILSNAAVQFSDLLGDQRFSIQASSVSSYSNTEVMYMNLRHRLRWGAAIYDFRDYYAQVSSSGFTSRQDQVQRTTGATFFVQYPMSRHYRVEGSVGYLDRSQDYILGISGVDPNTGLAVLDTVNIKDRFALFSTSLTGDTTRYQEWGPFQGKRFDVGVTYGADAGGTIPGNLVEYSLDFRAYKQLTRRSLLALRIAGVDSAGGRPTYYALGGINQLRGYNFRDFFGTRVAWSNLELRFPLVDQLRFPFGAIRSIRGFLFMDVGAAWFNDGSFYDPELAGVGGVRSGVDINGKPVQFKLWDSANGRFQDGRGSYGWGIQFLFIGGLQFNWAWSQRMAYTRYDCQLDPNNNCQFDANNNLVLVPRKADTGGVRTEFYIVFDF
ncbi:MAG: hypothetical protein LAO51_06685 [Acidobacteriia bacterium]|nr:hypothetical protein [Terriglobia bacterium]